jgi:hypothetical protein
MEFIFGMMVENMKGSTKMTRNTVLGLIYGLMAAIMKVTGGRVSSMVLALTMFQRMKRSNLGSGKMGRDLNGLPRMMSKRYSKRGSIMYSSLEFLKVHR